MSRIIPKEKLAGYQRWQAGSFDKPAQSRVEAVKSAPPPPAQEAAGLSAGSEQAGEMVVAIPFPTADDLARINEEARREGYQRGHEEGLAAAEAECSARTGEQIAHLATLIGNLQASLTQLDQEIAEQLLDLSLEVASQVLRSSLKIRRELLLPTIREALGELPLHHGNISLHLNPADAEILLPQLKEQLAHTNTHIVSDNNVTEGGCQVKAGSSEIDASIEMRWRRVLETMGLKTKEWLSNT